MSHQDVASGRAAAVGAEDAAEGQVLWGGGVDEWGVHLAWNETFSLSFGGIGEHR